MNTECGRAHSCSGGGGGQVAVTRSPLMGWLNSSTMLCSRYPQSPGITARGGSCCAAAPATALLPPTWPPAAASPAAAAPPAVANAAAAAAAAAAGVLLWPTPPPPSKTPLLLLLLLPSPAAGAGYGRPPGAYRGSPTSGCPAAAMWMRIWCGRPVGGAQHGRQASAARWAGGLACSQCKARSARVLSTAVPSQLSQPASPAGSRTRSSSLNRSALSAESTRINQSSQPSATPVKISMSTSEAAASRRSTR